MKMDSAVLNTGMGDSRDVCVIMWRKEKMLRKILDNFILNFSHNALQQPTTITISMTTCIETSRITRGFV